MPPFTFIDYKGLLVGDVAPSGVGGAAVDGNMRELADRVGPIANLAGVPTANSDSANTDTNGFFQQFSKWRDTNDDKIYMCADATPTAAVWTLVSQSASSPGGADTQVQYNNAGVMDGSPNFTFDGSTVKIATDLLVGNDKLFVDVSNLSVTVGNSVTGTDRFNVFGAGFADLQTGIAAFYNSAGALKFRLRDAWVANSIPPRIEADSSLGLAFNTTSNAPFVWYVNGTGNEKMRLTSAGLKLPDSTNLIVGTGDDLAIFHDGTKTNIANNTGPFNIVNGTGGDLTIRSTSVTDNIVAKLGTTTAATQFRVVDSADALLLSVDGDGEVIVGSETNASIRLPDDRPITFGASQDLSIEHSASTGTHILETFGVFTITAQAGDLDLASDGGDINLETSTFERMTIGATGDITLTLGSPVSGSGKDLNVIGGNAGGAAALGGAINLDAGNGAGTGPGGAARLTGGDGGLTGDGGIVSIFGGGGGGTSGDGGHIDIAAGAPATLGAGGNVNINAGGALGGSNNLGGHMFLDAGNGIAGGAGGGARLTSGDGGNAGNAGALDIISGNGGTVGGGFGGAINITSGNAVASNFDGGLITLQGGTASGFNGEGGDISLIGGNATHVSSASEGGDIRLIGGNGTNGSGGRLILDAGNSGGIQNGPDITITAGDGAGNGDGGDVVLQGGTLAGSGMAGHVALNPNGGHVGVGTVGANAKFEVFDNSADLIDAGILVTQVGSGDATIEVVAGATGYTIGIDNSEDQFRIAHSSGLSTPRLAMNDVSTGIGETSMDASALLHLSSTTQGFRKTGPTEPQRDAIGTPIQGLEVFNITSAAPEYYDGSAWQAGAPATFQRIHVRDKADLPTPVSGSIPIPAGTTLYVEGIIDLGTDNLEPQGDLYIFGNGFANSKITSSNANGTIDLGVLVGFIQANNLILENTNATPDLVKLNNASSSFVCELVQLFGNVIVGNHTFISYTRVFSFAQLHFTADAISGSTTVDLSRFIQLGPITSILIDDGVNIKTKAISESSQFILDAGGTGIELENPDAVANGILDAVEFTGTGTPLKCSPIEESTFSTPGATPDGVAIDSSGNLLIIDAGTNLIYQMVGITSTVNTSIATPAANGNGVVWAKGNLITCDPVTNLIYVHDGFSTTILTSFASPAANIRCLTFSGQNLISTDTVTGLIYIHDGISNTILLTINPTGITTLSGTTYDGVNILATDLSTGDVHVLDDFTGTTKYSFAAPGAASNINDIAITADGMVSVDTLGADIYKYDTPVTFDHSSKTWEIKATGGVIVESSDRGGSQYDKLIPGIGVTVVQDVWTDIAATGISYGAMQGMEKCRLNNETNGEVIWTGVRERGRQVVGAATLSRTGAAADTVYELAVAINGIIQKDSVVLIVLATTGEYVSMQTLPITRDLIGTNTAKLKIRNRTNAFLPEFVSAKLSIN